MGNQTSNETSSVGNQTPKSMPATPASMPATPASTQASPKSQMTTTPTKLTKKMNSTQDAYKEAASQYNVFSWLQWSPEAGTPCHKAMHESFPGALPGPALHHRIKSILADEKYGFKPETTLLGTSVCPDEINNECGDLIDCMKHYWGHVFPLGGISGAPFVGETGYKAFSHHVPDNGDIIIVYGPHVGITSQGEIGKCLREGQSQCSTSCGAVQFVYNNCLSSGEGTQTDINFDENDMQISWIKRQLAPHVDTIAASENPMALLAFQAYEMVNAKLEKIVNLDFGNGRLVLIGGIQINLPQPYNGHFLPLKFQVRQKGEKTLDLYKLILTELAEKQRMQALISGESPYPMAAPVDLEEPAPIKRSILSVTSSGGASRASSKMSAGHKSWLSTMSTNTEESSVNNDPQAKKKSSKPRVITKSAKRPTMANLMTTTSDSYEEVSAQYNVFGWLKWSPEPGTACHRALYAEFPGAMPGPALHHRIKSILGGEECFKPETTLLGTSVCPDEINNELGDLIDCMKHHWGHVFPLGGIGGAPFAGETGFKAFSHHVPDNGDIIVVYGPHIGVSSDGEIGKVLREGQSDLSTACGAVIGAYNACCTRFANDEEFDDHDMQMSWIKKQIAPHVETIQAATNPMALLAYQAYEMVNAKLETIVNNDFGSGRLVLIGGIQINMPAPFYAHFLPLKFEMRQKGRPNLDMCKSILAPLVEQRSTHHLYKEASLQYTVFSWLEWSPGLATPCLRGLHAQFPGSLPGPALHYRIKSILGDDKYCFKPETTLIGTSVCPDEINNECGDLIDCMKHYWGMVFPLGGIGGAPFAGETGFKAFSHHVPENGDILLVYGPHVAISSQGEIGKCFREGQTHLSTACGAVQFVYNACLSSDGPHQTDINFDENDMQIGFIKKQIAPHVKRIQAADSPMAALAYQAYEMVNDKLEKIINTEWGSGRVVLIGGIQINMPAPYNDQFLPLRFEIRQAGQDNLDLLSSIKEMKPTPTWEAKFAQYIRSP